VGTAFQQHVWQELQRIPYGTTITYRELAQRLGNLRAVRAVGQANGCNPIAIIIPCHRVVGHDGRLRGYASGLSFKQRLLQHEGVQLF
jgi:methylated-DNA-[protein]-cysteine S-methyltransferase